MRQKCVCCVVRSAPPSQFVMSVRSTIVLNVLTPTLVGQMLFVKYNTEGGSLFEFQTPPSPQTPQRFRTWLSPN